MNALSAISFVWTYVLPVIQDIIKVIMEGTYTYVRDRVDDVDVLQEKGLAKRSLVYNNTKEWLKDKDVRVETLSSVVIYLLIEIAVANLKRDRLKSLM